MKQQAEQNDAPSAAAIAERALSLMNEAMFTVALQRRRLRSVEPEDTVFIFRQWADFQFFIVALRRLRRAAELACRVPSAADKVTLAIKTFDGALPGFSTMRNVGEHIDDYAVQNPGRRYKKIDRKMLQVGSWNENVFVWLGGALDLDHALKAAEDLCLTARSALKRAAM